MVKNNQHSANDSHLSAAENAELAQAGSAEMEASDATKNEDLIRTGQALLRLERYEEALEVYDAALRFAPDQPEAHYGKGWAHFGKREWRKAQLSVQKAIDLAPDVAKYHIAAAACSQKCRDLEGVLAHLDAAECASSSELDKRTRWALAYSRVFAGLERLGLLAGWAALATMLAYGFSVPNLQFWLLTAFLPFLATSIYNLVKHYYRRAIWAFGLGLLWLVAMYLLFVVGKGLTGG